MNDEDIQAVADELNVSFEDAKEFLNCEGGCYTDMRDYNGEGIWMSGQLVARLIEALKI